MTAVTLDSLTERLSDIKHTLVGLHRERRRESNSGESRENVTALWRGLAVRVTATQANPLSKSVNVDLLLERAGLAKSADAERLKIILRATTPPAMTTSAGYAAELVSAFVAEFIGELQAAASIYGQLFASGAAITRTLSPGTLGLKLIARSSGSPQANGGFTGEGEPIAVRRASFAPVSLSPKKLSVISTFTEEMADRSVPDIAGVIRTLMTGDTGRALDVPLLDNVAASATRPAGLLNAVVPLTASAATPSLEAMKADVAALVAALSPATRIALLVNPKQAAALSFAVSRPSFSVMQSASVAAGQVIAVDLDGLAGAAWGIPVFDLGAQGLLHEESVSPQPIGSPGSPPTVAAPSRSAWQTDALAIRLRWFLSWSTLRVGAVGYIDSVNW